MLKQVQMPKVQVRVVPQVYLHKMIQYLWQQLVAQAQAQVMESVVMLLLFPPQPMPTLWLVWALVFMTLKLE
jgi:1-deoxy-D-xylulose 5-phosphate reductoisomerase